jgi:glycosyl hydrolase family 43
MVIVSAALVAALVLILTSGRSHHASPCDVAADLKRVQANVQGPFALTHAQLAYCDDFPDPAVLRVGHHYVAYSTNNGNGHIPSIEGDASLSFDPHVRDALPNLPVWSEPGMVWAPSVIVVPNGYLMYYSTEDAATGSLCLSTAFASRSRGPFVDNSTQPLLCDAIDPHPFIDANGTPYLLWAGGGTIHGAPLSADLRTLVAPPTQLIGADQTWEVGTVEAPAMLDHNGAYFLFFSGNRIDADYAIGYAFCQTPLGPCQQAAGASITSGGAVLGPGGADFFDGPNHQLWMSFHAWVGATGYPHGVRSFFIGRFAFR